MKIIITESQYSFLMKEQMGYYPGYGELAAAGAKSIKTIAKSVSQGVYDTIKEKLFGGKDFTLDEFVEKCRNGIESVPGIIILSAIEMIPEIGPLAPLVVFGLLLSYDLYMLSQGKPNWWHIIFDIIALLLNGKVGEEFRNFLKTKPVAQNIFDVIVYLEKNKNLKFLIEPIDKILSSPGLINGIAKWVEYGAKIGSQKFGFTVLERMSSKFTEMLASIVKELAQAKVKEAGMEFSKSDKSVAKL